MKRFHILNPGKLPEVARRHVQNEIHPERSVIFQSEVDMSEVDAIRAEVGNKGGHKPSYTSFIVKAVGLALERFPYANRRLIKSRAWPFRGARLQVFNHADVAVACEVNEPSGEMLAVMDVIRDAPKRDLNDINQKLRLLAQTDIREHPDWKQLWIALKFLPAWAVENMIRMQTVFSSQWSRYRGAAALVSSPAKYGVDIIHSTWPWPIGVSFGLIKPRPVVVEGQLVVRRTTHLSLNFDRRIMAGAQGARFFAELVRILTSAQKELAQPESNESPDELLEQTFNQTPVVKSHSIK